MTASKRLALNDEGFVFDPASGDSYLVNSTGGVLLRGLQAGLPEAELAARLAAEFAVEPEQAAADVEDFLVQLRALRLA